MLDGMPPMPIALLMRRNIRIKFEKEHVNNHQSKSYGRIRIKFLEESFNSLPVDYSESNSHPKDYPGQCYDPSTNVAKTVGAMWPMKDGCGRVMCEEMGNSMYLSYSTCPYVSGPPSCNIVQGDYQAPYPSCCPRVECPSENTVNDDQLMLAAKPGLFATYDVTLNDEDYSNSDSGFSDVFPLWRDIRDGENVGIDDEERPKRFIPKK